MDNALKSLDEGSVAALYPHLVQWWHEDNITSLSDVTPKSEKPIQWKCPFHPEHTPFTRKVFLATSAKVFSCGCVTGYKVVPGVNDLASQHPTLAAEWSSLNDLHADQVASTSSLKALWTCSHHPEIPYQCRVSKRVMRGDNCGCQSGKRIVPGVNDLATTNPELLEEWDESNKITPQEVTASSTKEILWFCNDHQGSYAQRVADHTRGKRCGCTTGRRVIQGFNDLATRNPQIAQTWDFDKNLLTPADVTEHSNKDYWWHCEICSESYKMKAFQRVRGSSCTKHLTNRHASNRTVESLNDLASQAPHLLSEWSSQNTSLPSEVSVGNSRTLYLWVCENHPDQPYRMTVYNKVQGSRCPCQYLSGRKQVIVGFNDLATLNPDLAQQWDFLKNGTLTPEEVTISSNKKVWWNGTCDHNWESTISDRTFGKGCPICANQRVLPGFNDLSTLFPQLASEWHPTKNNSLLPSQVSPGSNRKVWWLGECGHEWESNIYSRSVRDSGCFVCWKASLSSGSEQEVFDFIQTLGFKPRKGVRGLLGQTQLELDIYIEEKSFAVEFNGLYWHSEVYRDSKYHETKVRLSKEAGITLYQVWEDDWRERKEVIMRGIAHRLGKSHVLPSILPNIDLVDCARIPARKTECAETTHAQASVFLDKNHIQGRTTATHHFVLKSKEDGRLCAVLSVKRIGNKDHAGTYSIERYATSGIVVGGFTKLLKYAEKNIPGLQRWVTFADSSISDGGLYESNGFVVDKVLAPDYSYMVDGRRVHKFNYRLARFKNDSDLVWEEGLSERELALLNNIPRIWDSGKVRYVKEVS